MKNLIAFVYLFGLLVFLNESIAMGQGGQRGGQGMRGRQPPPLLRVFDANDDGELSTEEINGAVQTLQNLDRNSDGRLTAEELRPRTGGQRGSRGGDRRLDGKPQRGQRSGRRPGDNSGGRGGEPDQADALFVQQIMELDLNNDNLISRDELPEHMHAAFDASDGDNDGKANEKELQVLASHFRRSQLNPDGESDKVKNRPAQSDKR